MKKGFIPIRSAEGWQVSTPPILLMAALRASLEIFAEAGMANLAREGNNLSSMLIAEVDRLNNAKGEELVKILTPSTGKGCQVSLMVKHHPKQVFERLADSGIFADWREPDVIRVAAVPLYNTPDEVLHFASVLKKLVE
jgi:kynureninase